MKIEIHHVIMFAATLAVAFLIFKHYNAKKNQPQVNTMI